MFRFLGAVIRYAWPLWLIGWIVALLWLHATAPAWDQVARDREFAFLPADAPTRQGEALLKEAFPEDLASSNVVVVISRHDHELTDADRAFVKDRIEPSLFKLAREEGGLADELAKAGKLRGRVPIVASIRTPDDPGSGPLLVSDDRQAVLIQVDLTTELLEARNGPLLDKIQSLLTAWRDSKQIPAGLEINLFGSAVVGREMTAEQRRSSQAIEHWTILIVIVILALVYRAPFLALIPLATVFMATQVSINVLAHLARAGWINLFAGIDVYVTVVLYGTGIDYCLFLIARYREMRCHDDDCSQAMAETIHRVGPTLIASAATVIAGIGMMAFARFGKFHDAGIAVAISLAISLCVVLTFSTSLLRLFGQIAFWPWSIAPPKEPVNRWVSWDALARVLLRWPSAIWTGAVLMLAPLAAFGIMNADNIDYNLVGVLPANSPAVAGGRAMADHFPAGAAGQITALLYTPHLNFLAKDGKGQIELAALTHSLIRQKTDLELADVRSWDRPLGTGWAARKATGAPLEEIQRGMQEAIEHYICHLGPLKGHVTRLELTMASDPMSRAGIAALDDIEKAMRLELNDDLKGGALYFLGVTADMRDLRRTTQADQLRIRLLVLGTVFVVLVILLRGALVPAYLILGVLCSYFAALGAAAAVFWWLDPEHFAGLDWKVPIFLFTILVAIGEDYNIFLLTRVHEEQAARGRIEGIRAAVARTGAIISSCGIIMAGTFASLMASSTLDLKQLGFALALGVLIDTFIVRPVLVPAFLIVLERGTLAWEKLSPAVQNEQPTKPAETPSAPADGEASPTRERQQANPPGPGIGA